MWYTCEVYRDMVHVVRCSQAVEVGLLLCGAVDLLREETPLRSLTQVSVGHTYCRLEGEREGGGREGEREGGREGGGITLSSPLHPLYNTHTQTHTHTHTRARTHTRPHTHTSAHVRVRAHTHTHTHTHTLTESC